MRAQLLCVVIACLLAFSTAFSERELSEKVEDCEVDAVWRGNTTATEWSKAENWQDAKVPTEISKVLVLEAEAVAVLTDEQVQISSARIGSRSLLKITSGSKLTIFNREVQCFDTKWCSGHGECVGINECECQLGWTGEACDIRTLCEGELTSCGYCSELGIECNCGDNLYGQPQEYVSRLLLLDTTAALQASINRTLLKLAAIKALNKRYNPYTEVLEKEIAAWIFELQDFADGPLKDITEYDDEVLTLLSGVEALPDPCDATPEQLVLEELF